MVYTACLQRDASVVVADATRDTRYHEYQDAILVHRRRIAAVRAALPGVSLDVLSNPSMHSTACRS